jgi:hypothetical protein
MSLPVRSKKMAVSKPPARYLLSLDISSGKWSASTSWQIEFYGWTAASF